MRVLVDFFVIIVLLVAFFLLDGDDILEISRKVVDRRVATPSLPVAVTSKINQITASATFETTTKLNTMADFKSYLAASILTEDKVVSNCSRVYLA